MNIATKLAEERRTRLAAERLFELKEAELSAANTALPIIRYIHSSGHILIHMRLLLDAQKGITLLYEKTGPSEPVFWSFG